MNFEFNLKCGTRLSTDDLDNAGLSVIPVNYQKPISSFGKFLREDGQTTAAEYPEGDWHRADGVMVMTGKKSQRIGRDSQTYYLMDIDIEFAMRERYPELVKEILSVYKIACGDELTPCILETKSNGLRLSCYLPGYDTKQSFRDRKDDEMLLEFFSMNSYSRYDSRYRMVSGSILDAPVFRRLDVVQRIAQLTLEVGQRREQKPKNEMEVAKTATIGDLDVEFDANGRSLVYYPKEHCKIREHQSNTNAVSFYKMKDGSIHGRCQACEESWIEVKGKPTSVPPPTPSGSRFEPILDLEGVRDLPPDSPIFQLADEQPRLPAYIPKGASFRYFTEEERVLVHNFLEMPTDLGYSIRDGEAIPIFTPRFPFERNGEPDEVRRRRVYCTLYTTCPDCEDGRRAWWIDRFKLTLGTYCEKCEKDITHNSWAEFQWKRRPDDAMLSEYDGYIANDPMLKKGDDLMWLPNSIFHLGSGMRTGKTTYIFQKANEMKRISPRSRWVYLGANISQVRGIFAENSGNDKNGNAKWGLFHEGSHEMHREIGTHGVISTISSLHVVLGKLQDAIEAGYVDEDQVYFVIDEVDFCAKLMNATIMKELKRDNHEFLRRAIQKNGLVVAGQTENLISLECLALELKVPIENIHGYYKRGNMEKALVSVYEYERQEGMKSYQIACVVERCRQVIKKGKRPYVFCQGRRTAQIIASFFPNSLLYDAYERGSVDNESMLFNQHAPSKKTIVVTSCAVDVGISIKDKYGYSITVVDQNLRYHNSVSSPAQQMVRDREPNDREIHILSYENRLPTSPTFNKEIGMAHMEEKLQDHESEDDILLPIEKDVVNHLATRDAVNELSDFQLPKYIDDQMDYAGFIIQHLPPIPPKEETVAAVSDRKKEIVEWERDVIEVRSKAILEEEASHWKVVETDEEKELPKHMKSSIQKMTPISENVSFYKPDELTSINKPLASTDIRRMGAIHKMKPSPYEQLSHERAWEACSAVGFKPLSEFEMWLLSDDNMKEQHEDDERPPEHIMEIPEGLENRPLHMTKSARDAAVQFIVHRIPYDEFYQQKMGFIAVHHEEVIHDIFKHEKGETTHRLDYRRIGFAIQKLLYHIPHGIVTEEDLYAAFRKSIDEHYGDSGTLRELLISGRIGKANATKLRFYDHELPYENDDGRTDAAEFILRWGIDFIQNFYPCQLAKKGSQYILRKDKTWDVKVDCINADLKFGFMVDNLEHARPELMPPAMEILDFDPVLTGKARRLRKEGKTHSQIAEELDVSYSKVYSKAKDIKHQTKIARAEENILSVMKSGVPYSPRTLLPFITAETERKLSIALKRLVDTGKIRKIGRGKYVK